jgi:hypothetical protein
MKWLAIPTALFLIGCQTISNYDAEAYKQVTACKAEVLNVMSKAITPYADNSAEIERVSLTVAKAYEYDMGRTLNSTTIQMWDIIRDPNRSTSAGFFRLWKAKGTLSPGFIKQAKLVVGAAYDQLSGLESGKLR